MRLKLFPKFVIILILLAVIPAAVVGLRTISINRVGMQTAILELHTHLATSIASDVQDYLKGMEREIQYILRTLSAQMSWTDRQSVLQALLDTNEDIVSISIVDKKGAELLKAYNPTLEKDPRLLSRAGDETFGSFWKNPGASAVSGVYVVDTLPMINIIYPLGQEHCLYTTVTLRALWDSIVRTRLGSTGYAFMVNEKGEIIAHPDRKLAAGKAAALDLPIVQQALKAVSVGSSEYVHPATRKKIVGAYAPVAGLKWGVIIQQNKDEAYISVTRMQRQAGLLILISIIAAALVALFVARGLTTPIVTIIDAARRIANKDFSSRVEVRTRDELHDLAETFNDMTAELDRYTRIQVDKIVEEKTKIDAIIFSIADGILMTDREGKVQVANRHARELLGLGETGWQNLPLATVLRNEQLRDSFNKILDNPRDNITREAVLLQGDSTRYYLLRTEEVVTPQSTEKIGMLTVLRNITLEKELNRMKDDFLHTITHDLRNPMTSIRGFLKFLQDGVAGPVNAQQKKMLDIMDRSSLRLLSLINDILDIAKLESGKLNVNIEQADIVPIAQRTLEYSEGLALKKSIKLVLDAPPAPLPPIPCDPELVERVFFNLVSNALKFTPENGQVTIQIRDAGAHYKASVIDTGEGIPPEYITRIFEKFQQVAGQHRGGTGLGLTICQHIVEAHLGKIWAESTLGKGARFIFTLPKDLTPEAIMVHQNKQQQEAGLTPNA